jgi:putative phosphoribosyl transferase
MIFTDRSDAGRRLAARLEHLRGQDVVVLGLPRGGVAVAFEVARELGAPLDVILVRKLGVPSQLELAMGAIGEGGVRVLNRNVIRRARVGDAELASVQQRERVELLRQVARFRGDRPPIPLAGRTAVVVDDGIATGSTARAACEVVLAQGARRVVLAVPVAPPGWERRFQAIADELVCLARPYPFDAVGCSYQNFRPTRDDEVVRCLDRARELLAAAPAVPGRDGQPGVTP